MTMIKRMSSMCPCMGNSSHLIMESRRFYTQTTWRFKKYFCGDNERSSEVSIEPQLQPLTAENLSASANKSNEAGLQECFDNRVKWHSLTSVYLIPYPNHTKTNPSNHNFLYKTKTKSAPTVTVLFKLNTDRLHMSY